MAKANKEVDNKPRVRVRFLNVLMVLVGADLILLFAPGVGILNSVLYIGEVIGWTSVVIGIGFLVFGFKDLYRKQ
ncbi:hypothetical protein CHL67_11010 [Prosthecochloris sp. GSB1]|uniref:hypothetical protein n=1 Tax=Prosthecochloris sp. GSB1 TaxID=281093 RepID=UPI000B8D15E2|nr:hypothetical protein [Prosthecochloris sp. GSB1]ASQ91377.1 hypothetical protein CHL67_11010 [Prosthecochloris sp. GSB1]